MSGDCSSSATTTPHVSASKPYFARVYPISRTRLRTRRGMSTYVSVVISPAETTRPVVISVSQATRPSGSSVSTASSTESEIWSAILSGWPSVTDSDVKENERVGMRGRLAAGAADVGGEGRPGRRPAPEDRAEDRDRAELRQPGRKCDTREGEERQCIPRVRVGEAGRLVRHPRLLLRLEERGVGRELRATATEVVDPPLRRRDDELAADHGAVEREPFERAPLRQRREQLVERRRRGRRVGRLRDERDLRDRQARTNVDGRLAAQDR